MEKPPAKSTPLSVPAWAAFLRGINVGGRVVKMSDLQKALATAGLRDIKTVGASGNVLFNSSLRDPAALARQIETALHKTLGLAISVIVRSVEALRALAAAHPFKDIKVTPDTRLYVTFLSAPTKPKSGLAIPYASPKKELRILQFTSGEIFSVVDLAAGGGAIDAMALLEKEFGKNVTTRNWNTIKKLT